MSQKIEGSTGETTLQGTDGHQDPGKERDKEEGKLVSEDHPDNPEEENTVEDMEGELPFERQGINVGRSPRKPRGRVCMIGHGFYPLLAMIYKCFNN